MSKRKRPGAEEEPDIEPKRKSAAGEDDEHPDIDLSQAPDFQCMHEEAEVGIIEQVMVKNFMCHTVQDIRFGSRVNFVIGNNGSGKSAMMTAIVVGLGGKANVTNRGSSIKGFIKSGKNSAEVTVKLRNRGQDAFRPDMYGPGIIVERKISKESSSYRIKNSAGKLVSTKREELSHILEHFNIQVDNPLVILNQDTSRNFLNSKSPQDKYKFFLKATQLEQMKSDYINANESKEVALDMLQRKTETLPVREKEVYEWEQKYKALASLQELRKKMESLKQELIWACISEQEKIMEPLTKELRVEEARTPKFQNKVLESENEVKASHEKHAVIEKQLTELSGRVEGKENQYMESRQKKDECKKRAKACHLEVQKVRRDVAALRRDEEAIQKRVEEIQNRAQEEYKTEMSKRHSKIAQLQNQLQQAEAKKQNMEHEKEQFRAEVNRLKQDAMRAKAEMEEVNRRINDLRRHLQNLEGSRSNRLKRFGSYMPQLLQKIEEAHSRGVFHQKPIGPLGNHFTLKDQKWALAVEQCLKALMFSFCVNDHHDERELEKIMKQVCTQKKPTIITCRFGKTVYNTNKNRPKTTKYPTVLEVLNITDPVVSNCFIDQRAVEQVLLIEDDRESRSFMSGNPPPGTSMAYNKDGDQLYCKPFRYYSCMQDKAKILVQSVEEDIRVCKHELATLDKLCKEKTHEYNGIQMELKSQSNEDRRTQTALMRLQESISKIQMDLTELDIEEPTSVDVETLEEEVQHLQQNIVRLSETLLVKQTKHNEANAQLMQAEETYKKLDAEMSGISEQTDSIRHQLALAENAIQTANCHKQHYVEKKRQHLKKIVELQEKYDKYKSGLSDDVLKAEKVCPRLKTKRTSANLESEIRQIGIQITAEEKIRGNHEEIAKKYFEIRSAYLEIRKEVGQLTSFLKELQRVMADRQQHYGKFRHMIAIRAKFFFIVMLGTRKYSGKIAFDHKKESLELNVLPSADNEDGKQDMRSLSGGERSFSTVCFILALWDAMESPFRCLDEFDVFMDMVNRRISMDMMMSVAQNQKGRQFIFLTPQSMSHISIDPTIIKIFQMRAPERGQAALPFRPLEQQHTSDNEEEDN